MLLVGCLLGLVGRQLGQKGGSVAVHEDGPDAVLLAALDHAALMVCIGLHAQAALEATPPFNHLSSVSPFRPFAAPCSCAPAHLVWCAPTAPPAARQSSCRSDLRWVLSSMLEFAGRSLGACYALLPAVGQPMPACSSLHSEAPDLASSWQLMRRPLPHHMC